MKQRHFVTTLGQTHNLVLTILLDPSCMWPSLSLNEDVIFPGKFSLSISQLELQYQKTVRLQQNFLCLVNL